jgi:hypothetical protein
VSQLIGTLVKLGIVEEVEGEYAIADPVYRLGPRGSKGKAARGLIAFRA